MLPEIVTKCLTFRRARPSDFDAVLNIYGRPEVARMVASWPIPPDHDLIRERCNPFPREDGIVGVVECAGRIVGSAGISRLDGGSFDMGYGFHPDHWGKGYATEMGCALIDAIFARYDAERVTAGHWPDNPASARVLEKLGLQKTHVGLGWSKARGQVLDAHVYELTRAQWLAANPLGIETERLVIRRYVAADIAALHSIVSDEGVARMVLAFPNPVGGEAVANWAYKTRYRGRPGFSAGVFNRAGKLVGNVGLAPKGASAMYFVGRENWGNGYATEAMRAFLGWAFERYDLEALDADHFIDNPVSGGVLNKLGFAKTGKGMGESAARLEPEPVILYRLTRDRFEALGP